MDFKRKILKCIKGLLLFLSLIAVIIEICDIFGFFHIIQPMLQPVIHFFNGIGTIPFLLLCLSPLLISIILIHLIIKEKKKDLIKKFEKTE